MNVRSVQAPTLPEPMLTPEQMVAIAASRPAVLQQQSTALHAMHTGTTGQGTPAVDTNGHVDLYA